MKAIAKAVSLAALTAALWGCGANSANIHRPDYDVEKIRSNQRYVVDEPLRLQQSETPVGRFNAQTIFLADQIERNVDRKSLENTFIVTSFVSLENLAETTPFGRLLAENVIHELQVRKWKVYEVRLAKDITVNENGEFSLSRDIQKIKEMYKIGGVVTGTYSVAGNHVIVNARVMDIGTGLVMSSAQIHHPRNYYVDGLLFREDKLAPMKIVGDTPFSCRDIPTCWNGSALKPGAEGPRK